jgi:hypothetical protein
MAFQDYTEFIEPLALPIRGKVYTVPPMSHKDGLRLTPILLGEGVPNGMTDAELLRITLGAAGIEMQADGVPADAIDRAMMTAIAEYKFGRGAAEVMWKTGGDPKAIQALTNRAQRRTKVPKQSPSTGEADMTKQPASTSTTKASRKK